MSDDPRLGYHEASVEQQNANFERLYQQTVRIDKEMRAQGVRVDAKIDNLADKFDRKFDGLQIELAKQFRWTVGLIVTTMGLMVTLSGLVAGLLTTALR